MMNLKISLVQAILCQKWPMTIPNTLSDPSSWQASGVSYAMEVRLSLGARWREEKANSKPVDRLGQTYLAYLLTCGEKSGSRIDSVEGISLN